VDWQAIGRSAARTIAASVPVVLACLWVAELAVWARPDDWAAKAVMLFVGVGLSVTGYFGLHALMRSEELDVLWALVREKIWREARGMRREGGRNEKKLTSYP
jgi:putative peptidoglycan lipid II flippase